jgi:ABC-type antimicrobial peptide transport system permease subunit
MCVLLSSLSFLPYLLHSCPKVNSSYQMLISGGQFGMQISFPVFAHISNNTISAGAYGINAGVWNAEVLDNNVTSQIGIQVVGKQKKTTNPTKPTHTKPHHPHIQLNPPSYTQTTIQPQSPNHSILNNPSPNHPITQSPNHPITQSPNHSITQSPNHNHPLPAHPLTHPPT